MLSGQPPFYGQSLSTEEIMARIRSGQFSFEGPEWVGVSLAAKEVIEGRNVFTQTLVFLYCVIVYSLSLRDMTLQAC